MNSLKFIVLLLSLSLTKSLNYNENYGKDTVQRFQNTIEHHKRLTNLYRDNRNLRIEKDTLCNKKFICVSHENKHLNDSIGYLNDKLSYSEILNAQLNDSVICKTQAFHNLETQFNKSQTTIIDLEQFLESNFTELQNKNEEIVRKNEELQKLNNLIIDKNTTVEQLETQSKKTSIQLKENSEEIQSLQFNVTKSTAIIAGMNQEITNLKNQVIADNDRIEKLESVIASYEAACEVEGCEKFKTSNEVHLITVKGMGERIRVRCDGKLAGPGWTVIQRRLNGTVDFYQKWEEYKNGFGNLDSEFFIGLEKLYHITKTEPHELYIYLEDFDGDTRYARYDNFAVGSEREMYALIQLGENSGNITDEMQVNKYQKFSTNDRDNDNDPSMNCAERFHGGWWYNKCGLV